MENKSMLNSEYSKIVRNNPDKKYVLYLRSHPKNTDEDKIMNELTSIYGECKELPEQKLIIFIVTGNKVQEFINKLNSSKTEMYLSYIQSEDEIFK